MESGLGRGLQLEISASSDPEATVTLDPDHATIK